MHVMQGDDDQVPPGHIDRENSKVRFAPNSASSFQYPKSFNNDSSADITVYENLNEAAEDPRPDGLESSFDVRKPLDNQPQAMQANRTADNFNPVNSSHD